MPLPLRVPPSSYMRQSLLYFRVPHSSYLKQALLHLRVPPAPVMVHGFLTYVILGSRQSDLAAEDCLCWELLVFQNFVDDDTPAPEASIPVPKVYKKSQNYKLFSW